MKLARTRALVFDLDGTLVDSLGDIAGALTGALAAHGLAVPSRDDVRRWIGDGARSLCERAVAAAIGDVPEAPALTARVFADFGERYRATPVHDTHVYPGLTEVLDELAARGFAFAILSNKPHDLTTAVAARLLTRWRFAAIAGQHPGGALKPDPSVVRPIADALGLPLADTAMIGDSVVDVATGHAAEMATIAVSWGFRPRAELEAAAPDALVDAPRQLLDVLTKS